MPPKAPAGAAEAASSEENPATKIAGDVSALQDQSLKMMSQMGLAWVEGMSDLGSEVLSFVADRIKEDVKTQHKMLHCKNVNELQNIQSEFLQTAIDQYTAETGKLVQMGQDIYSSGASDGTPKG
ncbi:phasin family protein [uncultured Tateyamaria sp.]|uniref:phasin family protein n=1 Tax=uncultured Tateyamaria sp. TaxID=455651 RepID=UPI002631B8BC|nr:phasin family protein [uncultured Tateyamaria sp.]